MEKIGLIAGNRKLPFIFSQAARARGYYIVAVAIRGDTSSGLRRFVDKIHWIGLAEYRRMFEIFKAEGVKRVVMAGQISPRRLFSREAGKDQELKEMLASIKNKKADTIFGSIAQRLNDCGIELLDSTVFIKDYMPPKGTLTKAGPDAAIYEDVYFGLELAKAVASLDIGQTVAVKSKAVVAVEALEGTDNLIRRAARIAGRGIVVVKVSKPQQDMRFDIPVVGLNTVKNLIKAKARCLAIEADKTLFVDKDKSLELADKKCIYIVAV